MAKIDRELIQKLRKQTGLGMMDCRKALEESGGDVEKAIELLRKKGASFAAKRAGKATTEGLIHAYIHPGNKIGVMIEIGCETDFVASTDDMRKFANDICLHIAAVKPLYLKSDDVDPKFLEHEKSILREQLVDSGKPDKILNQIIDGKIKKLYSEICLLQQSFVKNDQQVVQDVLDNLIAKTGEQIVIKKFSRFEIGN